MTAQDIIAFGALFIGLVGLITSFILKYDAKKIKELERDNKKYKGRLRKALKAIQGYQAVEVEHAKKNKVNITTYRSKIRKDKQEYFDSKFLIPNKINEMMKDLENE